MYNAYVPYQPDTNLLNDRVTLEDIIIINTMPGGLYKYGECDGHDVIISMNELDVLVSNQLISAALANTWLNKRGKVNEL